MKIVGLVNAANEFFEKIIKQKCRIISVMPKDKDWAVTCEVSIDPDYTAKRGLSDIVEIYEVYINDAMEVVGFTIKETKRKASLDNE